MQGYGITDPDDQAECEERAAIIQYDAGMNREFAEVQAIKMTKRRVDRRGNN
jgi:hypothetical protein